MRTILYTTLFLVPSGAFAHSGHPAGTGHDLWVVGVAVALAAIYGLVRKA